MTTTRTQEAVRKALRDLADGWDRLPGQVRQLRLCDLAHPSLTGAGLDDAWEEYRDAQATADALEPDGGMSWRDFEPDLNRGELNQDIAREDAAMWAASALDTLVKGERH